VKTLTVRLPEALVAEIEAESRRRNLSKSDVVRERLRVSRRRRRTASLDMIADLVGSVSLAGRPESAEESASRGDRLWPEAPSLMRAFSSLY
jgi:Arc/MetJ-type ribon-helix-helix transcriptional regulator